MTDLTGRINGWVCDVCSSTTYAIHVAHGVTPFLLGCRATKGCSGMGRSLFYPKSRPPMQVLVQLRWEWYRMSDEEARKEGMRHPGSLEYHKQGGLQIRRLTNRGRTMIQQRSKRQWM